MKKFTIVIFLFLLLIVTGCGKEKNLVCVMNKEFDAGYTVEDKISTIIEDGKVVKENQTITLKFEDEKIAKGAYQEYLDKRDEDEFNVTLNGKTITLTDEREYVEEADKIDKIEFLTAYQEEGYTCE